MIASDAYAYPKDPELVIGLVAPIGTPLSYLKPLLSESLQERGFTVLYQKLSDFAVKSLLPKQRIAELPPFERYEALMNLGNQVRTASGEDDVLALFAVSAINASRTTEEPRFFSATAIVIDQLKRPEEVHRFRKIYGEHFLLLGLFCPKDIRLRHLEQRGMSASEAAALVARDEDDALPHGQRVSDTYHLADAFIEVRGNVADSNERATISSQLARLWTLVFGDGIETPTREEYGMYLASAASLRSSSLARQVGAAIMSADCEVLAVGANDIPCFPGGLYWGDETDKRGASRDRRDHKLGFDESDRMKRHMVGEILSTFIAGWSELPEPAKEERLEEGLRQLKGTTVTGLTEFARAVHAEMEAISSAVRVGVSIRRGSLYTTTFPCHNCAKHIVASGLARVFYVEPYPKSRALAMYGDSIHVVGESPEDGQAHKVHFIPFVGVAPRRFYDLFGRLNYEGRRIEYKDKETGEFKPSELGLRVPFSPLSYVDRESLAAGDLQNLKDRISEHSAAGNTET